jgi:hypothetical protein
MHEAAEQFIIPLQALDEPLGRHHPRALRPLGARKSHQQRCEASFLELNTEHPSAVELSGITMTRQVQSCLPRHQPRWEPTFLKSNGIPCRGLPSAR